MMERDVEILKRKIANFPPDLIEAFSRIIESLEEVPTSTMMNVQREEVLYRIQFHKENPLTKLDFFENIKSLEKFCA
ncbi:hypothetical protein [Frigoriflavimonas asaccharolytica]|uniref:Uncharacterized protein n=1 Tax=Frigoriflavimonas asaccharolytica TaxID=2735899 RepID=A0A8J8G818_9FLAO|nr:hypothetical protein [Frigoriflavimonas asaccharolytica]NRS92981.1 hypothetical protein [Frigoriflavimonas asaccharolytica]